MSNRIRHFLICSMVLIFIICIAVFTTLAFYLNTQNEQTITQLGNIYMSSMNERISMHFDSITGHRLDQLSTMTEVAPDNYKVSKETMQEWLTFNGHSRGYTSMAYCRSDGNLEMIYGEAVTPNSSQVILAAMGKGDSIIAVGYNDENDQVVLACAPLKSNIPGLEGCKALIGVLPISYIADTLSLEENESLVYSIVIRRDGSFVVRNSSAVRENYFDRVRSIYQEVNGVTPDEYIDSLKAAIENGENFSDMVMISGELYHMYYSDLPNSVWCLLTFMPYGALNESVETLGSRSFKAATGACAVVLLVLLIVFICYLKLNRGQIKDLNEARKTAEDASRSKSEFLSNMSHDIRTPMNAIVGMTAVATTHIDDKEQVRNCLKKITLSSKHLLGLINDVLDMSKIESGKMTLNMELVSLREVMDNIVSIVQPQIKAKHQNFNISIHDIIAENIHCDSVRLNQVLLNLLSNAMKFTPEGGHIGITLSEEPSPKGEDYVRVKFKVKDTGIGMSDEFQTHIFESFTREDNKRVHKIEGTGLGMTISKYIVDAMGGEITVSSKQGVGTEFHVTVDMERAEERVEDMILPDWNMLVVDDDRQLCESAVDSLSTIGVHAEWVLDGESAVNTAVKRHEANNDFHVILLDWKLPDMDGIQTARELRRQLGADVPILLMSAYDWSEIESEAREAGISGFIMKPLFRSTLFYGLQPYAEGVEAQPINDDDESDFTNKRILVAEDNELNWEIANELLQELGLELDWAENGQICVEMFQRSQPGYYDAVLMDIRMPIMSGYEATDAIRAMDRPDAMLPIIAMTADAYTDDIQRCIEHGMNAHIAKPIDVKEVSRTLKKFLEN